MAQTPTGLHRSETQARIVNEGRKERASDITDMEGLRECKLMVQRQSLERVILRQSDNIFLAKTRHAYIWNSSEEAAIYVLWFFKLMKETLSLVF